MIDPIIKKVNNGYYVMSHQPYRNQNPIRDEDVFVFESFESLVKQLEIWMEENKQLPRKRGKQ